MTFMTCPRLPRGLRLSTVVFGLAVAVSAGPADAAELNGTVRTGTLPVSYAKVLLYQAGTTAGGTATLLGTGRSDSQGGFRVAYAEPADANAVLYVVTTGGTVDIFGLKPRQRQLRFATVLGPGTPPSQVTINERTTVATAYAFAQFLDGMQISGVHPGPKNAALTLRNLVNRRSGAVGHVLATKPNGASTQTMREFNSLANMLATCARGLADGGCKSLFKLAKAPGGKRPKNTLQAAVNIAHYPGRKAKKLFTLSQRVAVYGPALTSPIATWTLTLLYDGGGGQLDGPGNMVFDKEGNVWIGNNYQYQRRAKTPACGDTHLIRLTPDGRSYPGAPYTGGGIYGVGFGIAMDPDENIWLGNFGFSGRGCDQPLGDDQTVSLFNSDGVAQAGSPYADGDVNRVQGLATDDDRTVWFANCGGDSVTVYPLGDHTAAVNHAPWGLEKPFGAAVDSRHHAWFTANNTNRVFKLDRLGNVLVRTERGENGIKRPMGIAVDSLDNAWVSNSGAIAAPCYFRKTLNIPDKADASVSMITPDGTVSKAYTNGGVFLPWGIAVDGDDNVWVANFGGFRVGHLCGARPENCPPGVKTGESIAPKKTGYAFDGLVRVTAVQIDASGNVWLTNNWLTYPYQTNPGGKTMAVMVGMAAPVKTPQVGPPQKP